MAVPFLMFNFMSQLLYCKTRNVKSPTRANEEDAGLDLYIPDDIGWTAKTLLPGEDILIDSGLRFKLNPSTMLVSLDKSGVATKSKLIVGAKVIDKPYTGNVHIHLINFSHKETTIRAGEKIVQLVEVPIGLSQPVETTVKDFEFQVGKTTRGSKGFGSSGNGFSEYDATPNVYPNVNSVIERNITFIEGAIEVLKMEPRKVFGVPTKPPVVEFTPDVLPILDSIAKQLRHYDAITQ